MVKDIVRQAILIKLKCSSLSPLISPAEFCCASGFAVKLLALPQEFAEQLRGLGGIGEMREMLAPRLEEAMERCQDDAVSLRLLKLLTGCRVNGEVTDELRELFDMGMQ